MFQKLEHPTGLPDDISFSFYEKEHFLLSMLSDCPTSGYSWQSLSDAEKDWPYLSQNDCTFLLLVWRDHNEIHAQFYSTTSHVRALEFLNALFQDQALVRGDSLCATAQISQALLWVQIDEIEKTNLYDYICTRCMAYFTECVSIDASTYAATHREDILALPLYHKRKIPWSYVQSTDIAPEGTAIEVRSLENESGLTIEAGAGIVIMIGSQGEVYHIASDKFHTTYEATDEPLDIFTNMTVFLPEVQIPSTGEYVNIDEMAHVCYPKPGQGVYAQSLVQRTKVFPIYSRDKYFLGKTGDYLVIRSDDLSDIYIVQKRIFEHTYEMDA